MLAIFITICLVAAISFACGVGWANENNAHQRTTTDLLAIYERNGYDITPEPRSRDVDPLGW